MNSQQPHPLPDPPVVPTSAITHPSYESEMFGTWFRIVEVEEQTQVGIDQVEHLFHQAGEKRGFETVSRHGLSLSIHSISRATT
ncbi:MAG: hypothetical protein NPIRA02_02290 [Nitrospirales bacterium]|nr:MAG: hypothetical protein NPIRA02_02290 [Nitrospirales bacterium]